MPISEADLKLLWGRAAGRCSRTGCQEDLTRIVDGGKNYNIGEMAHVIARSRKGPRGDGIGGADTYHNLILLCPTCHREIDKAPDLFPEEMIRFWKQEHEDKIRRIGTEERCSTLDELIIIVNALLAENYEIWRTFGPRSQIAQSDPGSNAHEIWELRRVDRLVPNNRRIINVVRANHKLLDTKKASAFPSFVVHAEAFEQHVQGRRDFYPLFPKAFGRAFAQ